MQNEYKKPNDFYENDNYARKSAIFNRNILIYYQNIHNFRKKLIKLHC